MPDNQGKPVNFGEVLTSSLAQGLGKFHAQKIANQEQDQQNALMAVKMQNDQMEREARMAALRANMAHVDAQTRELTQKMAIPYEQRMQMEAQQKEAEMRLKAQLDAQAATDAENRTRAAGFIPTGWKKDESAQPTNFLKLPNADQVSDNIAQAKKRNADALANYEKDHRDWKGRSINISEENRAQYLKEEPQKPPLEDVSSNTIGTLRSGGMTYPDIKRVLAANGLPISAENFNQMLGVIPTQMPGQPAPVQAAPAQQVPVWKGWGYQSADEAKAVLKKRLDEGKITKDTFDKYMGLF